MPKHTVTLDLATSAVTSQKHNQDLVSTAAILTRPARGLASAAAVAVPRRAELPSSAALRTTAARALTTSATLTTRPARALPTTAATSTAARRELPSSAAIWPPPVRYTLRVVRFYPISDTNPEPALEVAIWPWPREGVQVRSVRVPLSLADDHATLLARIRQLADVEISEHLDVALTNALLLERYADLLDVDLPLMHQVLVNPAP